MDLPLILILVTMLVFARITLARIKTPWARTISELCDTVNFVLILAFMVLRPFVAQAFFIPSGSMENTLQIDDRLIVDKFSYRLHEPKRQDVVVFEAPTEATNGQEDVDYIKRLIGVPGDTIRVTRAHLTIDGLPIGGSGRDGTNLHSFLRQQLGLPNDTAIKLYPDHLLINGKRTVSREDLAKLLGHPDAKVTIEPGKTIRNGQVLDEPYTLEDPDYDYPSEDSDQPITIGKNQLFMMGDNRNNSFDSHYWGPLQRDRVVGHAVVLFWPPTRVGQIR